MLRRIMTRKLFYGRSLLLLFPAAALNGAVYSSSPTPTFLSVRYASFLPDTTILISHDTLSAKAVVPAITLNKHVGGFVKTYLKKEEAFLQKMRGKSGSYFRTIEKVFDQHGIPQQLKYLAVVESELRSNAKSKVGARGLWQLMPLTARELGLRIGVKTDERVHTYRSTVAAARYLQALHGQFGDWLLVLAAYNCGPGPVYKAMKKAGSRNFWALQRFLPAESRRHVKRFIGVHYFFEGEGSITTQTKAEAKAWQEKLEMANMPDKAALNEILPKTL